MSQDSQETKDNTPNEVDEAELQVSELVVERGLVDFWQFSEYAKLVVGDDEYKADPEYWSMQFQRDYETIVERLEIERKMIAGEIDSTQEEIEGLSVKAFMWERLGGLRLISYEQFILEFNQGIFREERFYCDKGRAWLKKVSKVFAEYGYPHVRKVTVEGRVLLEVSKNSMGVV